MNTTCQNIKQRLSLREPLAEALDVLSRLVDKLTLAKPAKHGNKEEDETAYKQYLQEELQKAQTICPLCKDFERDFPSFAFSIATGIGKTRLMGACIAYLYLKKGIRHFFILAPNLTLYEKLMQDFGDPSYEKYVFRGISEFVHNEPYVITGDNYNSARSLFSDNQVQINIFNISKFNTESKEGGKKGVPKMRRLSEYLGQSYFDYLASLDDLVILMDEAHRYHADASKKAINELRPILGLEMTATPTDEKGKSFKNIIYEYNLAQALADGKYVKIPTVAKRRNFVRGNMTDEELDILKIEDAVSVHEHTKLSLELYAKNNNLPLVKPFILIVCKNIQYAKETYNRIENDMFNGKYAGKVLQIDSSTKKDEEVDRLFVSLEKPDNQIEIVIHVNMLKEGWDVTNLYTIVPLRAADAPILVEQQIVRGLRLPYGGKRTGVADVDKLTVIAHENFEAVIAKANDPNSVLSKVTYVELDNDDLTPIQGKVVPVATKLDIEGQKTVQGATTDAEKKNAQVIVDARRAVWKVIPLMNSVVKSAKDLSKPEIISKIKSLTCEEIVKQTKAANPLFADEEAKPLLAEVDNVVETVVKYFIDNIIEIPRMTIQQEAYKAEFEWFDLDVSSGFDLPALKEEIIRVSLGAGEKYVDIIQVVPGRKFDTPINQIVNVLIDHDEIDYDENSELLYHLAGQAVDAITSHLTNKEDVPKIVNQFKTLISDNIFSQMQRHFVMTSVGYVKPKVLPFTGLSEQYITEIDGFGRVDYRDAVKRGDVPKYIFTGFMKSYYTEYKFDSQTELDFANVLESDSNVLKWLRPASNQFNIYWSNGAKRYEPDFIVETADYIYMVETKAKKDLTTEEVQAKKKAAEEYCKNATEYALTTGGKPWKYHLLRHDMVDKSKSFDYLMAIS